MIPSPFILPRKLSIDSQVSPIGSPNTSLLNTPLFRPRKLSSPLLESTLQEFDLNDEHRERFDRIMSIKIKNYVDDNKLDIHPILLESITQQTKVTTILPFVFTHKDFTRDDQTEICKQYRDILHNLHVTTKEAGIFIANEYAMSFEFQFHDY